MLSPASDGGFFYQPSAATTETTEGRARLKLSKPVMDLIPLRRKGGSCTAATSSRFF